MKCIVFALTISRCERGVNLWDVLIRASNAAYLVVAEKLLVHFQQKKLGLLA